MNCVVLQPSFVPWRGYFHQIQRADVFVLYDDVQYDHHGWRNRNRIKTAQGSIWMTVPVLTRGVHSEAIPIKDVRIDWQGSWAKKHLRTLGQSYARAPHRDRYLGIVEAAYAAKPELLVDLDIGLTETLARELGLKTRFVRSSTLAAKGDPTERLVNIVRELGASHYISGPAAKDYLQQERFAAAGLTLEYMTYDYPTYPQLHPPFDPRLSILDLLFMVGPEAPRFIWGTPKRMNCP